MAFVISNTQELASANLRARPSWEKTLLALLAASTTKSEWNSPATKYSCKDYVFLLLIFSSLLWFRGPTTLVVETPEVPPLSANSMLETRPPFPPNFSAGTRQVVASLPALPVVARLRVTFSGRVVEAVANFPINFLFLLFWRVTRRLKTRSLYEYFSGILRLSVLFFHIWFCLNNWFNWFRGVIFGVKPKYSQHKE